MAFTQKAPKQYKVKTVNELHDVLAATTVILTDFQGLSDKQISAVRSKLRESGAGYKVVKNTFFRRAAQDTSAQPLSEGLAGATAVAFTSDDPVAVAKALKDFTKGPKPIVIKNGVVDGALLDAKQIDALASIPPKNELVAMVVGGLQSPITNLVGTMNSMMAQLVMTLQAVADKQGA